MSRARPDRPFALRPATSDDAAALARVDTATSMEPWSEATFLVEVSRRDRRYVAATNGNAEVVGYAGMAMLAGDAHVMGVAVLPSAQGRGCGRLLLDALCEAAARTGSPMTLEVRPSNDVARRLYRSLGFTQTGRRPGYYPDGEDALVLWRAAAGGLLVGDVETTNGG